MIKASAKSIKSRKATNKLPSKWRSKVVEILSQQGFKVEEWKISDIKRGRYVDDNLTIPVLAAIKKIRSQHKKKMKHIRNLKRA